MKKEVVLKIEENDLLLGESMMDGSPHRIDTGKIENVFVRMNDAVISFDKDAFLMFGSEAILLTMRCLNDCRFPKRLSVSPGNRM